MMGALTTNEELLPQPVGQPTSTRPNITIKGLAQAMEDEYILMFKEHFRKEDTLEVLRPHAAEVIHNSRIMRAAGYTTEDLLHLVDVAKYQIENQKPKP